MRFVKLEQRMQRRNSDSRPHRPETTVDENVPFSAVFLFPNHLTPLGRAHAQSFPTRVQTAVFGGGLHESNFKVGGQVTQEGVSTPHSPRPQV
ncbi:hypothetical protein RRG08_015013 [Elysia crispata]|uniref:Uncharacterized protein n=1 Tax=Elysia crispata TaxID=231223 RepID=A0AAE1B0T0_9GAST|nr:hypothetical protein RRG08_015013 [Elysia crispata]